MKNTDQRLQEYAGLFYAFLSFGGWAAFWTHHAPVWRVSLVAVSLLAAALALANFALRRTELTERPVAPLVGRLARTALWLCIVAFVGATAGTLMSHGVKQ